jgi:hypothetical protein
MLSVERRGPWARISVVASPGSGVADVPALEGRSRVRQLATVLDTQLDVSLRQRIATALEQQDLRDRRVRDTRLALARGHQCERSVGVYPDGSSTLRCAALEEGGHAERWRR